MGKREKEGGGRYVVMWLGCWLAERVHGLIGSERRLGRTREICGQKLQTQPGVDRVLSYFHTQRILVSTIESVCHVACHCLVAQRTGLVGPISV